MPGFEVIPYNDLGALKVGLSAVAACPISKREVLKS